MAKLCAPTVASGTLQRIASVESSFNPFAIGVVGGRLARQPVNRAEALATANALKAQGWDYSVGLVQVNQKNFGKYGLTTDAAFDPCTNLRVGSRILDDCYKRAGGSVTRRGDALSCYYAGDFRAGYRLGYVAKVTGVKVDLAPINAALPIPVIPRHHVRPAEKAAPDTSVALFVSAPNAPASQDEGLASAATARTQPTALLF